MSLYISAIGTPLSEVLERAASSQPAQFAGYCANLEFWVSECEHFAATVDSFERRYEAMRKASWMFLEEGGARGGNSDDCGERYQEIKQTTSNGERLRILNRVRGAMRKVLARALELRLINVEEFDDFFSRVSPD